jgi:hypothetical protein
MTSRFLEQQIHDTLAILAEGDRESYARASLKSLQVGGDAALGFFTANDIAVDGPNVQTQYRWRVCALKPVALEFLRDVGVPERGLAAKLNWRHYEKRFGVPPVFIHQKPLVMMLGYSEWLHLVLDEPPQITVPVLEALAKGQ